MRPERDVRLVYSRGGNNSAATGDPTMQRGENTTWPKVDREETFWLCFTSIFVLLFTRRTDAAWEVTEFLLFGGFPTTVFDLLSPN